MKILLNKSKSKIRSFNVSPSDDGYEVVIKVKDDDIANDIEDIFKKVVIHYYNDEDENDINKLMDKSPKDIPSKEKPTSEKKEVKKKDFDISRFTQNNKSVNYDDNKDFSQLLIKNFNNSNNNNNNNNNNKTILVIEDDEMTNKVVTNKLKKTNYQIISAKNGEEGINKLVEYCPDLIITDLMMPYTNGLEVVEYVREKLKLNIPIIILSALEDEETILTAFKMGIDDYLTKPFGPEELILRIKRLLIMSNNSIKQAELIKKGL